MLTQIFTLPSGECQKSSSGHTFHAATRSWDAVLQVALETAGNGRGMEGKSGGGENGERGA